MGWDNPAIPWRDFHDRLTWHSDGGAPPPVRREAPPAHPGKREETGPPWAELHVHSSFSFLDGASSPERLVEEAADLGGCDLDYGPDASDAQSADSEA